MSNTPKAADDCMKILDNGHAIILMGNGIGSYTAIVLLPDEADGILGEHRDDMDERRITDDFTPSQALYRLTEKFTTGRIA